MEIRSKAFGGRLIACHDLPPKPIIFGQSEAMKGLSQIAEGVASAGAPILILGERGTGKEVLARFIHSCSPGSAAPFLKVNPRAPEDRATDGVAFRVEPVGIDANNDRGVNGGSSRRLGTLFLDEVAELPPESQLELLQLIQGFRSFISSGGNDIPATFRVIGTSTRDLDRDVASGEFREDLLSFLSVVTLRLPPLRERREDIPQLANYFWRFYSKRFGCQSPPPSEELISHLQEHDWPGNIRELESVMKRYVVLGVESLRGSVNGDGAAAIDSPINQPLSLKDMTREAAHALERKIILRTLEEMQWNRRRTARVLNISYRALLYKIKEGGLLPDQSRASASAASSVRRSLKSNHEAA